MDAFPAFVPLAGARVVVAGEGEAADAKARLFDGSPADLVRVAGDAALTSEAYRGARLVFVAGDEAWSRAAAAAARTAGAWVNAVDRPELCDFNTPGIIDRGAVVGAVGTVGAAPVLAVRLRQEWESRWPAGLGDLALLMRALRPAIREAAADWAERRRLLSALMRGRWADAALAGDARAGGGVGARGAGLGRADDGQDRGRDPGRAPVRARPPHPACGPRAGCGGPAGAGRRGSVRRARPRPAGRPARGVGRGGGVAAGLEGRGRGGRRHRCDRCGGAGPGRAALAYAMF